MNFTLMNARISSRLLGATALLLAALVFVSCGPAETPDREGSTDPAAGRPPTQDELLARIPETFKFAAAQYEGMLAQLKSETNGPRTFENGKLKLVAPRDWTSGFFPGALWFLYEYTGDTKWKEAATDYTTRLESVRDNRGTHDLGFMIFCSYGNAQRLAPDPKYREVILHASRTLISRFNPQVGLIRSWDFGSWEYPVIIDNMMNLEMLMWATREANEPRFREVAISHADRTILNHFREDGSSVHVVDYNPASGAVRGKQTHQGFSDDSAWARGQAWGLYGFTMMFRETGNTNYLDRAQRIARFLINHPRLPADKIPYWDYDAPDIPDAPRDASAGAIMAAALLELSGQVDGEFGRQCFEVARQQLLALTSPAYLAGHGENGGFLLKHCTGNKPKNSEVDVPLNYADYYLLQGLMRYSKMSR